MSINSHNIHSIGTLLSKPRELVLAYSCSSNDVSIYCLYDAFFYKILAGPLALVSLQRAVINNAPHWLVNPNVSAGGKTGRRPANVPTVAPSSA